MKGSYDSTVRLYDLRALGMTKPIQVLTEAKDAVQSIHLGSTYITTGSVDGVCRTYDLRMGELRSDYIGRKSKCKFSRSPRSDFL